jgi:hypothetical protein
MKVAFLVSCFTVRGVEGVAWAYAWYNRTMLNNESIIFIRSNHRQHFPQDYTQEAADRFRRNFQVHEVPDDDLDAEMTKHKVDVCYLACHGAERPGFVPSSVPVLAHCVFSAANAHIGATYRAAISTTVSKGHVGVLPNIIDVTESDGHDLRDALGIPKDSFVFGRIGGWDSFDIPWARTVVSMVAADNPGIYFVFVHTQPFEAPPNVKFLPATVDPVNKRRFIDTCDAMIHARDMGETFGCACGEFAICGLPVVTCECGDLEHIRLLGSRAVVYRDPWELKRILTDIRALQSVSREPCGYHKCTPEAVMPLFRTALVQTLNAAYGSQNLSVTYP